MTQKIGWRTFPSAATAVVFLVLSGCGYGENSRVPVQGKVAVDGAPVEDGAISFVPTATGLQKASGTVKNGTYSIPAAQGPNPGMYRVEVVVRKKTGRQVGTPGDAEVKMDEVAEVGTTGSLSADVKAKANTFDFTDLKAAGVVNQGAGGAIRAVGD
jgi:hypothetical protein